MVLLNTVIFSISCFLTLVQSINDMGSLSFKCIFDPAKTITKIVPGKLVIQHAYESGNNYGTNLQAVDCFINVAKSTIINKKVEEITQEFETRDLKIAEEPLNVDGEGLQKRKLKRVINTTDGAAMEIYYRSIAEDKQFKVQNFTKVTKIISSKKAPHIIVNSKRTHQNGKLKDVLSLRKRAALQRSINQDKLYKTKNYTKITKKLKSNFIKEKIALAKKSKKKSDNNKCYKKQFYSNSENIHHYCPKTHKPIATHTSIAPVEAVYKKPSKEAFVEEDVNNNAISTITTIETDYEKQSVAPFEENKLHIFGDSIENNILHPSSSEISANEILDEKPNNLLFVKINPDDLMENILFHPRVIYA